MKKILEAKFITICALSIVCVVFVGMSVFSAFYMNKGYAIPTLILTVAAIVLSQRDDRRDY